MLKRMLKDGLPTVVALTLTGCYSVIDGIYVGYAAGDVGLAAINLAWPIPAVVTATGLGIGTGGSVIYSNARGRGDAELGRKSLRTTLFLLLSAALLLGTALYCNYGRLLVLLGAQDEVLEQALIYSRIIIMGCVFQICGSGMVPLLRNLGMPVRAMLAMICGMLTNLILNYILIIHLSFGIRGASIGTVTAQAVVCAICVYFIWKKDKMALLPFPQGNVVPSVLRTGLAAFGVSLAPTVVLTFTNLLCLKFGGKEAVAAYAVISYIVFPVQSLLQGVGDGLQPLMSYYVGAGDTKRLGQLRKNAYGIIAVLGTGTFVASVLLQNQISGFFHLSDTAQGIFSQGFTISALSFFLYGFSKYHVSYLNSGLKIRQASALIYGECLVVAPCLLFLCSALFGLTGIWISLPLTSAAMIGIFFAARGAVKKFSQI